ncbi:hypothetical protein CPT_Percy52 [Caulobacter phage Percy]|uniref:Uncharacterized protein n=1 Tax=Caulobacter phage Percy TaxID=1701809 RepID=A0A0M5M1G2_9CAUD|nr:hypothetical protein CPT_Percy52 [Caulobacter phage Percy]ALF01686.1 hypothetical protein CPT_Percy52 [Caulobacter phage Percy]
MANPKLGSYTDSTGSDRPVRGVSLVGTGGDGQTAILPSGAAAAVDDSPIADPVVTGTVTQGADTSWTFASAGAALVLDTAGQDGLTLQVTSANTTITVQWSASPSGPWYAGPLISVGNVGAAAELAVWPINAAGLFVANSYGRYARIVSSAATSINVFVDFKRNRVNARGMYLAGAVNLNVLSNTYVTETTTNLAASATYTGASRAAGTSPTVNCVFAVEAEADQNLTVFVEKSVDGGTTWRPCNGIAGSAVTAGTTFYFKTTVMAANYRVRATNTGASTTTRILITSAFASA